jgi:hypothetical protein
MIFRRLLELNPSKYYKMHRGFRVNSIRNADNLSGTCIMENYLLTGTKIPDVFLMDLTPGYGLTSDIENNLFKLFK